MRSKKILVGVTLVTFLTSDFSFGIAPALGQSPVNGDGQVPMPSLSGDGNFGRLLPGPSTQAPYQGVPQPQQQVTTLRPIAAAAPNVCQPGGARSYQTAAFPRNRTFDALPGQQLVVPNTAQPTVTQVTVTQGAASQATAAAPAQPAALQAAAAGVAELSRTGAAFNGDPV